MPAQAVTATAVYENIPVATYAVAVTGGTGGGSYAAGATVTLTANAAPAGQQFKQWNISPAVAFTGGTGASSATARFTMPAQAVTATAVYENIPVATYAVAVTGGTGGGSYAAGATVTLTANAAPAGQQFKQWNVSPALSFTGGTGAASPAARFTMPAQAVTATAVYENTGGTATINIADIYSKDGQLLVNKGDIFIVGEHQYRVLYNAYTIYYWRQNSLKTALTWWTDYLNSYAASGVVIKI
jgi:hypothetical protein